MFNGTKQLLSKIGEKAASVKTLMHVKSPKIMFYGGCGIMAVGACCGIYKAYRNGSKNGKNTIRRAQEELEMSKENFGGTSAEKHEAVKIIGTAVIEIVKDQAVPLMIGLFGYAITKRGFDEVSGRLATAVAIGAGMKKMYDDLYHSVEERYGAEEAAIIRNGLQQEVKEVDIYDPTTGKKDGTKKVQRYVRREDKVRDMYSFLLDETTVYGWSDSSRYNLDRLKGEVVIATNQLRNRHYLTVEQFLSIIKYHGDYNLVDKKGNKIDYKMIKDVGWVWHPDSRIKGDGIVKIGIEDTVLDDRVLAFLDPNDPENNLVITLNVDGYITDEVERLGLWKPACDLVSYDC